MTDRELARLKLEKDEAQELTGKWIAVIVSSERTGDPQILRENDRVVASDNPIDVQSKAAELFPKLIAKNQGGKAIYYCYITPLRY